MTENVPTITTTEASAALNPCANGGGPEHCTTPFPRSTSKAEGEDFAKTASAYTDPRERNNLSLA